MRPFRLQPFVSLLTLTSFALMTLSGTEVGVSLDTGAEQGIRAVPDQSLKQIAKDRKVAPLQVFKVLLLPQYRLNDS